MFFNYHGSSLMLLEKVQIERFSNLESKVNCFLRVMGSVCHSCSELDPVS